MRNCGEGVASNEDYRVQRTAVRQRGRIDMLTAKSGDWVKLHYVCTLENGEIVDSSEGLPAVEVHAGPYGGEKNFSAEVLGMAIEEEKEFSLSPDEAFGYPVEGKIREIALSDLRAQLKLQVGLTMLFNYSCGPRLIGTVAEINEDTILVDFNHPLAGKRLNFKIRLIEINARRTGTFSCSHSLDIMEEVKGLRAGKETEPVTRKAPSNFIEQHA
ncbi:MAG: FKBP-type peptidyl-prolyl cis-trans isomerase [Syntrophobacteraceae bacterium]